MIDTNATAEDNLEALIAKLKSIDVSRVNEDEAAKGEALKLARKITATLEGPINRATDLVFKVYLATVCLLS